MARRAFLLGVPWSIAVTAALLLPGTAAIGVSFGPTMVPVGEWAYGAQYNGTASWTNGTGGYAASIHAFFGWQTIITQTNFSPTVFQLEANRTAALDFQISYCKPSCSAATTSAFVNFSAWETEVGFANFSTAGTVTEGGIAVPALALLNVSDRVQGNVTETANYSTHLLLALKTGSYYFSVAATAQSEVEFLHGLGLVPVNLTSGAAWNSSDSFAGSGAWAAQVDYRHVALDGTVVQLTPAFSGSVDHSGTVSVDGTDLAPVTLNDGSATDSVGLVFTGPFHLREGFLLVPAAADIFGGTGNVWASYLNASAAVSNAQVNIASTSHLSHLGLLASASAYTPNAGTSTIVGIAPADANGGAVVQAQPESVSTAQGQSACLLSSSCPSQESPPPALRTPVGAGGIVVLVVLILVVAVIIVVVERRQVPKPPHPNARLYPPGAAFAPPPTHPAGRTKEPAPQDDPLGNLW